MDDALILSGIRISGSLQWRILWERFCHGPSPWRATSKLRAEVAWPEGLHGGQELCYMIQQNDTASCNIRRHYYRHNGLQDATIVL
jgi:hypothetical protein